MNIVTGYTGTPHVTANEAQALNQGIFGPENYVLDVGNKFAASMFSATTITIQDGEGVMQGVQFRIAPGQTEYVSIQNGTSGYNRIDLICARYTKDAQTGVEAVNLLVIKGTPSRSTPEEPTYNTGNILLGDSPVDFPLYRVTFNGINSTLTKVFDEKTTVLNKSETVAAVQKGGSWEADSVIGDVRLRAGTYVISIRSKTTASVTPTAKSLYMTLSATYGNFVEQNISNNDEIASVDVVSIPVSRVATFHVKTTYPSSTSVSFTTQVSICRV